MVETIGIQNNAPYQLLCEGGKAIGFQGKTNVYRIEIYNSGYRSAFIDRPEYSGLIDVVTGLYLDIFQNRDRDISIERMRKSLSRPRTLLMLAMYQGVPVGFGIFPRFLINRESVLYSTRAFLPEHEGQGLGLHFLDEAIRLHQKALSRSHRLLRWGVLMTQNALSVVTLRRLDVVEKIFPFDELYTADREAQYYMLAIHSKVFLSSRFLSTITGVSKGEMSKIGMNETYRPNREHQEAWQIYQRMVSPPPNLDMNREGGDVVYVTFRIRRLSGRSAKTPLAQAS